MSNLTILSNAQMTCMTFQMYNKMDRRMDTHYMKNNNTTVQF